MATNYNCISYTDDAGRDFLILKTLASNIKLVSLYNESKTCPTVKESGYYGMNASFFNMPDSTIRPCALHNIALQDGKTVGSGATFDNNYNYAKDGTVNVTGNSVICWSGSTLNCLNGINYSTDAGIPASRNSWAQGGFGLYLCDRNWQTKFESEPNAGQYPVRGGSARTGILVNRSTKYVYLFACRILTTTISELRSAMMAYAGLTEGGSAGNWAAIMTDGGRSAQLYSGEGSAIVANVRGVPQIIALKNKA